MATKKNAAATTVDAPISDYEKRALAAIQSWEKDALGFAPYFKVQGLGDCFVGKLVSLDFRDPKMPRFIFENPMDIPIQCYKGPVDNAEPVIVNKGEFFTLSQYKGLPIENYMDIDVMYKVVGTQETDNGTMYVWEVRMSPESKKLVNARRKEEMSVLVARRTLGEGEVLTPPALTA
jgi:hypothetical protein